ncbi:transglycosylase family protein [Streptomyces sp. NPDC001156]
MLSGNGRHRRPRQAPALLVAAGVTGSAIAIPLLGATGASAASGITWDRVAECASGGSWSADTGNDRYGGLQLTQQDWDEYGGLDYAPRADQASRSQQIAVAERILDGQGVSVWSACGLVAGLSEDSASAHVDTGLAGESSDGGSSSGYGMDSGLSESSGSTTSGHSSPSSSASSSSSPSSGASEKSFKGASRSAGSQGDGDASTEATKSDESDKSGQSDTSSRAGRHRGSSADESAAGDRAGDSAARHASRGSSAGRDVADGSYTVRPGDNLTAIADSLDLKGGWAKLYDANKKTVGADPDLILPGQNLEIGTESDAGQQ